LDVDDQFVGNRRVCVVDTGYDITHEDLPKASTGSSVTGTDGVSGEPWNEDDHGHGSHCAGTIAAVGNNNKGVVGVNRNGKLNLHIGRVFGVTGSWISGTNLITVVRQCRDAGSNVVSMSLGGGGYSQTEFDAYESLYKNDNVLLVAAAGNGGNSAYSYPASYEPVMSVAAIDSNKNKAGFSQYNDQVDIAAPGVSVKSTLPGNTYAAWSGTSMATPHVSGVAALVWSHYPDKPATEIRQTLEGTAEDLGAAGRDNEYGHGLVRADLAIIALSNGQYTNAPTISPAPSPKPTLCEDSPPDWHDSDGPYFDCAWYAIGRNCETYGSDYRNDGKVANEAW
jgi:serine protease